MTESRLGRPLLWLASIVFGLPPLLVIYGALSGAANISRAFLLGTSAVAVIGFLLSRRLVDVHANWLLSTISLVLVLLWPETLLRVFGSPVVAPSVAFRPTPELTRATGLRADSDLFWALEPHTKGVNSLGFVGPEVAMPKPSGTLRIAFFGDSCTWQGYPAYVPAQLTARVGRARVVEAINLGVPGYSTYQGRLTADRWARALELDIGVVYFGWNDHWLARGRPDAQRGQTSLSLLLSESRLAQIVLRASDGLVPRRGGGLRVSPEEFRANLESIGDSIVGAGGRVLMVTAPSAHRAIGVSQYFVNAQLAATRDDVITLHRRYNEIVREVAADRGWALADLERQADALAAVADVFGGDGIHFTIPVGLQWVAGAIAEAIAIELGNPEVTTLRAERRDKSSHPATE